MAEAVVVAVPAVVVVEVEHTIRQVVVVAVPAVV
jgi:hypothetical protein